MIRASFFSRKDDVYPQYKDFGTFEDLAASIKEFLVVGASQADKSRAPCICPAEFLPEKTRSQKNTLRVHFGMLDFDGLTEAQVEQVLDRIGEVSWFFYTTHGHHEAQKRGLWKFRLGFPFSASWASRSDRSPPSGASAAWLQRWASLRKYSDSLAGCFGAAVFCMSRSLTPVASSSTE